MNPQVPNPNRVLVIDDEESIHKLVVARLRPEGLEVISEFDGERGIERAVSGQPDVILLDIGLPNVDGFEVCRRLKEHPSTRNIPIIFLTGTTDTESKVRGLDLGAVDYVTKPFDQVELRARVRAALRTKRLQDILEQQSFLDGLTGLWNRSYLDRRLEAELNVARRYGRPLTLVLADVDHFKRVNDSYGHLFGDIVLQGIAEGLRAYARRSDIVARYGGEEFAILLTDTTLASRRPRLGALAHVRGEPPLRGALGGRERDGELRCRVQRGDRQRAHARGADPRRRPGALRVQGRRAQLRAHVPKRRADPDDRRSGSSRALRRGIEQPRADFG